MPVRTTTRGSSSRTFSFYLECPVPADVFSIGIALEQKEVGDSRFFTFFRSRDTGKLYAGFQTSTFRSTMS